LDSARAFYDSNLELCDKNITWPDFKAIFQKLFRSIGAGQYHFTQLQTARQWKDESLGICRSLQQARPKDSATGRRSGTANLHYDQAERMMLPSYTSGLAGTPGRHVRLAAPTTVQEALGIAISMEQAELLERRMCL